MMHRHGQVTRQSLISVANIYIYVYIYDMNRASVNEHQARSEVNGYFPLVDLQHDIGYVHFASLPLVPPAPTPIPFADSHAALG